MLTFYQLTVKCFRNILLLLSKLLFNLINCSFILFLSELLFNLINYFVTYSEN